MSSRAGRFVIIVKMLILPRLVYRFGTIALKILSAFFVQIDKMFPKFKWKWDPKDPNTFGREEQSCRTHISQFQNLVQLQYSRLCVVLPLMADIRMSKIGLKVQKINP